MSAPEFMIFPNTGMQALACLIFFLGLSIITICLSRRVGNENLTSWEGLSQLTWPRTLVLLVFIDSWVFLFSGGMLIFGVGLERSQTVCAAAIYLCIGCYATSKLFIYTFLIEKVHVVWSPAPGIPRFKSRVYIICLITVVLYIAVIALLVVGHISTPKTNGACSIGLKPISAIPLLSYDLYINVFLTTLFLWPLFRSRMSPPVKKVAIRTLIAAIVALTTSTVNVVTLAAMKGSELGWVCLGSCSTDVVINALAIFWVTKGLDSKSQVVSVGSAAIVRGLPDREQRHTAIRPPGDASSNHSDSMKAILSQTPDYSASTRQTDLEYGHGRAMSFPSRQPFRSLARIFGASVRNEEHGLQIRVTREFSVETPISRPGTPDAEVQQPKPE